MPSAPLPDADHLLALMPKLSASDLHLKVGSRPLVRIAGAIRDLDFAPVGPEDMDRFLAAILSPAQRDTIRSNHDLDFAYQPAADRRFRINVFRQRGHLSLAARRVLTTVPTFEEAHLPEVVRPLGEFRQGLVLVCGITGSGKSTTLATLIDGINATRRCHIVTIEDPIEYLYTDRKAFINQREIGIDVESFSAALTYVVRQDPDVILVGEMRDPETFTAALQAAETGHLVFGTLHASSVSQAFARIIDMVPAEREPIVRHSLAFGLRGIVCQQLIPSILPNVERVPVCEVLRATPTVQRMIREREDHRLADAVQAGVDHGMQDFTMALYRAVQAGQIHERVAMAHAHNPPALRMRLDGIDPGRSSTLSS